MGQLSVLTVNFIATVTTILISNYTVVVIITADRQKCSCKFGTFSAMRASLRAFATSAGRCARAAYLWKRDAAVESLNRIIPHNHGYPLEVCVSRVHSQTQPPPLQQHQLHQGHIRGNNSLHAAALPLSSILLQEAALGHGFEAYIYRGNSFSLLIIHITTTEVAVVASLFIPKMINIIQLL